MARLALAALVIGAGTAPAGARPESTSSTVVERAHPSVEAAAQHLLPRQPLPPGQNGVSAFDVDAEAEFVAALDAARAAAGLPPLQVDPSLTGAARDWAVSMASRHVLEHASDITVGVPADWTKAGENVGRGGSVPSIFEAFMASPGHAANVLDPAYTRIGVGVVWSDDGVLYTAHRFAGAASDAPGPPATPDPTPTAPPTNLPFADPTSTADDGSQDTGRDDGDGADGEPEATGDGSEPAAAGDAPRPDEARLELTMRLLLDAVG